MLIGIAKRLGERLGTGKLPAPLEEYDKLYSWRVDITQHKKL
jgi:hypothetical protein